MTTPYVDPNTVHTPTTGASPPASWGTTVRDGLEFAVRPPACIAQRTAAQSIPNSTLTAVEMTAADLHDSDNFHSTSSNTSRLTVPSGLGGLYLVGGVVPYSSNTSGGRGARIRVNGSTVVASVDVSPPPGALSSSVAVSALVSLIAGDYVELLAFQNSGGALNTQSALPCRLWCVLQVAA